jgi:hypothetical protein
MQRREFYISMDRQTCRQALAVLHSLSDQTRVIYVVPRNTPLYGKLGSIFLHSILPVIKQIARTNLHMLGVCTKGNISPKHWYCSHSLRAPCGEAAARVRGNPFHDIFFVIYSRNVGEKMHSGVYMSFTEAN